MIPLVYKNRVSAPGGLYTSKAGGEIQEGDGVKATHLILGTVDIRELGKVSATLSLC
jgi:hypothetical protein